MRVSAPPSRAITHTSVLRLSSSIWPLRSETKAIRVPSGDHCGSVSSQSSPEVICFDSPLDISVTQRWERRSSNHPVLRLSSSIWPLRSETKAIRVPSGDHCGSVSSQSSPEVICFDSPLDISVTQRWERRSSNHPVLRLSSSIWPLRSETKAIRVPSGDHCGSVSSQSSPEVICFDSPLDISVTQRWERRSSNHPVLRLSSSIWPLRSETKAIRVPSGDHCGSVSSQSSPEVICFDSPLDISVTQRWERRSSNHPVWRLSSSIWPLRSETKAIRVPSGDHCGSVSSQSSPEVICFDSPLDI